MFKLNRNFNIFENVFQGQATIVITKCFSEVYVLWCNFNPLHPQGPLAQLIPLYKVPSYMKFLSSRHERKTNKSNKEVS